MFFEPTTNTIYATLQDCEAEYPDAGPMGTEDQRNAAGIYRLWEIPPVYDPLLYSIATAGVQQDEQGRWRMQYSLTQLPVEQIRAALIDAVSTKRRAVETGGLTLPGGATVGTTIDDQNRITSVIANAQLAGVTSVDFKARDGWVTLGLDHMRGIAGAIALHVQACFSAERAHHEAIAAADLQALLNYDINTGWPGVGA